MTSVFLSYAHDDESVANAIAEYLQRHGVTVISASEILKPGDQVLPGITQAIEDSDAVVFLLSKSSSESAWLETEAALATGKSLANRGGAMYPVLLDRDATVPFPLRDLQWIVLGDSPEQGLQQLMQALATREAPQSTVSALRDAVSFQRLSLAQDQLRYAAQMYERNLLQRRVIQTASIIVAVASVVAAIAIGKLSGPQSSAATFAVASALGVVVMGTYLKLQLARGEIRRLRAHARDLEQELTERSRAK